MLSPTALHPFLFFLLQCPVHTTIPATNLYFEVTSTQTLLFHSKALKSQLTQGGAGGCDTLPPHLMTLTLSLLTPGVRLVNGYEKR